MTIYYINWALLILFRKPLYVLIFQNYFPLYDRDSPLCISIYIVNLEEATTTSEEKAKEIGNKITLEQILVASKLVRLWRRRKRANKRWKRTSQKIRTLNRFVNNKNSTLDRSSSITSLPNLTLPKE